MKCIISHINVNVNFELKKLYSKYKDFNTNLLLVVKIKYRK